MGLMDKFNKGGVTFDIDINGFTFTDLATLHKNGEGEIFKIDGLYINKKGIYAAIMDAAEKGNLNRW